MIGWFVRMKDFRWLIMKPTQMPATPRTAGILFGMGWNTQLTTNLSIGMLLLWVVEGFHLLQVETPQRTVGTWRFVLVPSWRAVGQRVNPRYTGPEHQLQTWRCSKTLRWISMKLSKSTRGFRQLKQPTNLFGCRSHTQHSSEALITKGDVIAEYSW